MRIDVFSDVVCPWCFVGKRHLDKALAATKVTDTEVHWHAFQLNPDLPPQGVDRRQYLEAKFGPGAIERIHERLQQVGASAGIDFRFDKIERSPNTFDAHRLLWLAGTQRKQGALKEALLTAYFLEGRDLGDRAVIADIASQAGVEGDIHNWLPSDAGNREVREDIATAARLQINGVPFFIFAGRIALAGAQPPDVFMQALEAAAKEPDAPAIG